MDGEWKVENGMLTFLQFKDKSCLATNNLVMKSPRVEFFYDFRVEHQRPATPVAAPRVKEAEVLVWAVAPEIYDIKSFDAAQTVMNVWGLALFLYTTPTGQGVLHVREFPTPSLFNVREVFSLNAAFPNHTNCLVDYRNKDVRLNMTMDFAAATLRVSVNGAACLEHRISQQIFPVQRATSSFFGYSTENDQICARFREISTYKEVALLTAPEAAFSSSVNQLVQTVRVLDPLHFKNASLSNIMLLDVS